MSSERDRREFQAGLAEEVDAWLRGDRSRRISGAAGRARRRRPLLRDRASRCSGRPGARSALAGVELADPSTPFGQAQAAAVKASTEGPPENSAYRAVQAAKQYEARPST